MADRINIHEHTAAICEALGLVPNNVARLDITPREVVATVFKVNENGSKYVEDTSPARSDETPEEIEERSKVATETFAFEVQA